MLRIRVTTIEKFRRFLTEASIYDTEESLLESLTGKFEGNEYTRIGTAFHKIAEVGDITNLYDFSKPSYSIKIDDFLVIFNQSQIDMAVSYKNEFQGSFNEIRAEKVYSINGVEILVSGGADKVFGNQIRDTKTKYSYYKGSKDYTDSVQWKLYLDIFELPEFYFDIFEFRGYNKLKNGYDVSGLNLIKHDPIHCLKYSGMQDDIEILLGQFIDYIKFRNLEHLFQ